MIRHLLIFFTLVFICFPHSAIAQSRGVAEAVDAYLSARTGLGRFSGAVLIARGDQIVFRKGYGFADVENRIPFTPETQFMAASITKMFTAMSILKLRDKNKLKLGDSICQYIENCPEIWNPITIDNVLRHTSGIPDYEAKLDFGTEKYLQFMTRENPTAQILAEAKKLPLDFKPGERFKYSNTGYIVLGFIIQKASGESFSKYVEKNILRPAGMKESGIFDIKKPPRALAKGYTYGDIGWEKTLAGVSLTAGHLKKTPQLTLSSPAGDAGLFSTVDDLFRWSRIMNGGRLVSPRLASEVFDPGGGYYGFGWFVLKDFNRKKLWHTGTSPGYVSEFIKYPEEDITIILFSNLDRARLSITARDVSAIILGEPYDMPVSGTAVKLSEKQLANLEGEYKTADGKMLKIKNEPDYLTAYLTDANNKIEFIAGWIPISPTEFYFPMKDGKVTFSLDETGKAVKINMRYRGEDHFAVKSEK